LRSPGRIDSPISREGAFLANNVLFAAFAFVVLLGTVFPLLIEALNGKRISVGVPYFNRMTMPIGLTLLFLMAVAPVLPWRKASGELLRHRLLWPAWIGTGCVMLGVLLGQTGLAPLVAFGLGGFAAGSAGRQLVLATRRQGWRGLVGRANGGMIVHLGVVVIAVAFAASASNVRQSEFTLSPGQTASFAGHQITYVRMDEVVDSNKTATRALVTVDGNGPFSPGINKFTFGSNVVGTPSVYSTWRTDVALSLLDVPAGPDQPATIRVTIQPLIMWLWIGGAIMAFGTLLAAFPRGRRRGTEPVSAPVPDRRTRPSPGDALGGGESAEPTEPAEPAGVG
jgi:cytochrome c-type biogenesis protein CcmF